VRTASVGTEPAETDWGAWAVGSFTTEPKDSSTITLTSPQHGARVDSLTPTLTWSNADKEVFYYEVQISKDLHFETDPAKATAPVYWELRHGGVTNPPDSYAVPSSYPLEPHTTYYWRVRPRLQGDAEPAQWSLAHSFDTP
jgi:hypothetical protein